MPDIERFLVNQTEVIAKKFGGKAKLADALGHKSRSTVQGWKESGWIRPCHYPDILRAADECNVELEHSDFQLISPEAFDRRAA